MALRINGTLVTGSPGTELTLLDLIRDVLRLRGTKAACNRGECGACTVLLNGRPVMSCNRLAVATNGDVLTIEGVAEESRDLREAFAEFGGFQCGYCTAGQVVHATAILRELEARPGPPPANTELDRLLRHRLSGNICRCTGYSGIVEAVTTTFRRRAERAALAAQAEAAGA